MFSVVIGLEYISGQVTYVVCLECGKEFVYDFGVMKRGKEIVCPVPYAPQERVAENVITGRQVLE